MYKDTEIKELKESELYDYLLTCTHNQPAITQHEYREVWFTEEIEA